jgi:DNA invertase Pin-like site-specific DNA recombinase
MKSSELSTTMAAAIYARKSTDQSGVSDAQRSVARRMEHARTFATRQSRAVSKVTFSDDGIGGAEFEGRPGLQRLLSALKPEPRFSVLIVSELSRLGRDQIESQDILKRWHLPAPASSSTSSTAKSRSRRHPTSCCSELIAWKVRCRSFGD